MGFDKIQDKKYIQICIYNVFHSQYMTQLIKEKIKAYKNVQVSQGKQKTTRK